MPKRSEALDAWRIRQALATATGYFEALLALYQDEAVSLSWSAQEELIQSGVAYRDPTSKAGVALATWVRTLMEEVGERGSRVLRTPSLEGLLKRDYLELLGEAAHLAEEGEREAARDYLRRSLRVSGDLRTFARRFETEINEAREELLAEGLPTGRLLAQLERIAGLYRRFVDEFDRVITTLGSGRDRKDLPLLERIARVLEKDGLEQEAWEVRGAWQEVARTLRGLLEEVQHQLQRLDQQKEEQWQKREAFWRGVQRALKRNSLGASLVSLTPSPLPERENVPFFRGVIRRVGSPPPREEQEVVLEETEAAWEEEALELEGQAAVEAFLAQDEEPSFYAWAAAHGWEGSARSLLALSLLLDPDLEALLEAQEEGDQVVDVRKLEGALGDAQKEA